MFCRPMKRWIYTTCCMFTCLFVSIGYSQYHDDEASFNLSVFSFEDKDDAASQKYLHKAYQFNPNNPLYCHFLEKLYLTLSTEYKWDFVDILLRKKTNQNQEEKT